MYNNIYGAMQISNSNESWSYTTKIELKAVDLIIVKYVDEKMGIKN